MAYKIVSSGKYNGSNNYVEIICDSSDDINNLPTSYDMGSKAWVIANKSLYLLNSNKEWKEFVNYGTSGSQGATLVVTDDDNGNVVIS